MSLMGPGRSDGRHTQQELTRRQQRARREDANASTRPNTVTVAELKKRQGR